ncbi:helix-turn-helix transcriptional regulator [Actinomadura formosensis]|uniref:helix-turn-helix transcriptional regulator n=1 Tax=Actinomadura formosensis TaxID=60706 RepID=UPI00082B4758|nr:LuxR family transcriptional regulator [Actinomadura formosensis]
MALDVMLPLDLEAATDVSTYRHDDALAELESILTERSGGLSAIELRGDRWSGKTTLLKDFALTAAKAGWPVAAGSASTSRIPFAALIDAFDGPLGGLADTSPALRGPGGDYGLAEIFPSLGPASASGPRSLGGTYGVFRGVRQLIETLGAPCGFVLLMDDMHWADPGSLDLLRHLLRHPPENRLVLVVAHRPRQGDKVLSGLINTAAGSGVVRRIALGPLREREALDLLPDDLSGSGCARLLRESEGNPGLLVALNTARAAGRSSEGSACLPPNLLTACLRDFRVLSTAARLVAQSAAVLGEPFEPDELRYVARVDEAELWSAIDELVGEDLFRSERASSRLRFANRLLRQTAYQAAGPGWLMGAHARALEFLMERGKSSGLLAPHVAYTASIGDETGALLLLGAAAESIWTNPLRAASWVRTAVELRSGSHRSEQASELLLRGKAEVLAGLCRTALATFDGLTMADGVNPRARADGIAWQALARHHLGEPEQARADLDAAITALPAKAMCTDAEWNLRRARLLIHLETRTPALAEDVAALGRCLPDLPGGRAADMSALLAAALRTDRPADARLHQAAAARGFDRLTDDELPPFLDGYYWLARVEQAAGGIETPAARCERGLRVSESCGLYLAMPRFAMALSELQLCLGDTAGAARHATFAAAAAAGIEGDRASLPGLRQADRPGTSGRAAVPMEHAQADEARLKLDLLSGRELQIAFLVSDGHTNEQIARKLDLSPKTVETYLVRIRKKLVVACRAEIATIVGRSGR